MLDLIWNDYLLNVAFLRQLGFTEHFKAAVCHEYVPKRDLWILAEVWWSRIFKTAAPNIGIVYSIGVASNIDHLKTPRLHEIVDTEQVWSWLIDFWRCQSLKKNSQNIATFLFQGQITLNHSGLIRPVMELVGDIYIVLPSLPLICLYL